MQAGQPGVDQAVSRAVIEACVAGVAVGQTLEVLIDRDTKVDPLRLVDTLTAVSRVPGVRMRLVVPLSPPTTSTPEGHRPLYAG